MLDFILKFPIFGELGVEEEIGDEVEFKFNMSDQHLMIRTYYFQGYITSISTMYTISLFLDNSCFSKFLLIQNIIKDKMITLGRILKYLCSNLRYEIPRAMNELSYKLIKFY
jgi:hypothetical protein